MEEFGEHLKAWQKAAYDMPKNWHIKTDVVWPCCGFLQVLHWGTEHTKCDKVIMPYRQQQLQIQTKWCSLCGRKCKSFARIF